MDSFLKDVAHSLRMFLRSPKFTFAAVGALALGIGANAAIFSVVNSVLLQPIHAPDPRRRVLQAAELRVPGGIGSTPSRH